MGESFLAAAGSLAGALSFGFPSIFLLLEAPIGCPQQFLSRSERIKISVKLHVVCEVKQFYILCVLGCTIEHVFMDPKMKKKLKEKLRTYINKIKCLPALVPTTYAHTHIKICE